MLTLTLLSCFTIMSSTTPVLPGEPTSQISKGGSAQPQTAQPAGVTNQNPEAESAAPQAGQQLPEAPLQPGSQTQGGPQFLPFIPQYFPWYPLGGSPMFIPVQPSVQGTPANQPSGPQQPLVAPPYTYFPVLTLPYTNQMFSPYGFQRNPQTLANPPPSSPVLPAEAPSGASQTVTAAQPIQQQQQVPRLLPQLDTNKNPQLVYMLQQTMTSPLGSVSSEELQMAANARQLGVYLTSVLTSPPAGAAQPLSPAAGLKNPQQQSAVPTVQTSSAGVAATQGPQQNTNRLPAGLEGPTQAVASVQTPAQAELKPSQGNTV